MTKSSSGLLLSAVLALTVTAAQAEEDKSSANYMLPLCRSTALCHGIVQGMLYMGSLGWVAWIARKAPPKDPQELFLLKRLCITPPDIPLDRVTINQAVRVVIAYIEARPDRMYEDFTDLALEALQAAWPCK
jgi:hypothetical protein